MAEQRIKASIQKIDGKAALVIEPIMLSGTANVKPEADGTVHRATLVYLSNRRRVDGESLIDPIKGMKGDAPFLSVTLSADIDGAREMGYAFVVKEAAKPVKAKRLGVSVADLTRSPGKVRTRKLAENE